jgi:formylglycine-generating enzyme required for sulfatase activity
MSFRANSFGIYDMGGNAWEWIEDWYNDSQKHRVLRGAAFVFNDRGYLLSSYRLLARADIRWDHFGFRCVIEAP